MTQAPDPAAGQGGGTRPPGSGGARRRRRGGRGRGSGGGGGQGASQGQGQGQGQGRAQGQSQGQGNRNQGGGSRQGGSKSSAGKGAGGNRGGQGTARGKPGPTGAGQGGRGRGGAGDGQRQGASRSRAGATAITTTREPELTQPAALEDARADLLSDQRTAAHHAHRRARLIASAPAVVVLVVVGAVVTLAASPLAGAIAGVVAGILWWTFTLREARRVVLRSMRVQDVDVEGLARLENLVDGLCASMGLTPPEIRTIHDPSGNAIVVGRRPDDAVLVVTTGLLVSLDPVALEGVLAHELIHVKNGDIAPATVAVAVMLPLALFSASVGDTVHRWAGRGREFRADADAVRVTRYPPGLRDALSAMSSGASPQPPSPLAQGAMARATRWLWAVALPDPGGTGTGARTATATGGLDAPAARIAALDEW
jgi:Zn-dependent protease with chaperone function